LLAYITVKVVTLPPPFVEPVEEGELVLQALRIAPAPVREPRVTAEEARK
jgi:hypothetical protein